MGDSMEESKPHPSEFLEFTTVAHLTTVGDNQNRDEKRSARDEAFQPPVGDDSLYHHMQRRRSVVETAAQKEHRMTFTQALRLYPKAIGWSFMISLAIIMEGFDTALISSFYAFPEFTKHYGVLTNRGTYSISTKWQSTLSNGSTAGAVVGLFANGVLTEYFGYRKTMIGALIALGTFIFLSFFAFNLGVLLAGQILCGLSWGVFSTLSTTYAAEIMPLTLRGYLTANTNLCWLVGQIIANGILRGLLPLKSTWSYRIPFGLQWVWITFILIGMCFAPESPWWLVKKGRTSDVKRALLRLTRRDLGFDVDSTVAMMEHTNEAEKRMSEGRTNDLSYQECFRGTNLRRTEIVCMIFMIQNLSGLPVIAFAAWFYRQIGFGESRSFNLTTGMHGLAILGAMFSILLMKHFGQRQLYLIGLSLQFVILMVAAVVSTLEETPRTLWATASMVYVFIFVFDSTIGPLTYTLVAEVPSTRLRVKSVALARVSYNLCSLVTNVIQQHMLNTLSWNWRGKSCYFWAGSCLCCFVYCFWRLPETKGLTYLELDLLFEKRAPARKFKKFQRTLANTGYFNFFEDRPEEPTWREPRQSEVKGMNT